MTALAAVIIGTYAAMTNLSGVVTFARDDLEFFFMEDSAGTSWHVGKCENAPRLEIGQHIAVTGKREISIKHRIAAKTIAPVENAKLALPAPREIAIRDIFADVLPYGESSLYGRTLTTEGLLRDINRRQASTQLLVGEDDKNIQFEIPIPLDEPLPEFLVLGATVRITGALAYTSIENVNEGLFARVENVELIPASKKAVALVKRAPFWTVERLATLMAWVMTILVAVFAWAMTLRRMVEKRTRELGESIRLRQRVKIEADAARRERLRLAADLHDGFQQYLAGATFRLKAAMNYLPEDAANCREQLEKVRDALQHTQNGLRTTLWAMNEESEGPESLLELFKFVARRLGHWDGIVEFRSTGEERKIARNFAGTLLLILQEAVGNAIKHGKASKVLVETDFREASLALRVVDDGCGFDPGAPSPNGHFGLASMRRRTSELGGEMSISSKPGRTLVAFTFPF